MNERTTDRLRINNAESALIRQRVEALAALTKLEGALDLLRQLVDAAPFAGMPTFENDALTVMDHLREASREMWTQINEMIGTINGKSLCPANRHVLPTSSQKAKAVKIKSHLGTGNAWAEATSTHLAFYEFGPAPQFDERIALFIPIGTDSERERLSRSLVDLAEFYENQLWESQKC